jgi:predicted nucleic acid binding AN1-type Zn finger protein
MTSKTELMDIGEHCAFCGQIDFLPFKCSCNQTFCKQHRFPEIHQCSSLTRSKTLAEREQIRTDHLPPSQSLFPDRSNFKVQLKTTEENPTTIKGSIKPSALKKLKNFFANNKKSIQKKPPQNATKKLIELSKLKSVAKGDEKVPATERIYIWVQVIDNENEKFDSIVKNPVYVSRSWPMGRALDSIALSLALKNTNNRTTDESQKLNLFQQKGDEFSRLSPSSRCNTLTNGDTVFIVRGSDV